MPLGLPLWICHMGANPAVGARVEPGPTAAAEGGQNAVHDSGRGESGWVI